MAGCTQPVSAGSPGKSGASRKEWGEAVSKSAGWHLENRPRLERSDCSGLVESVLTRAGAPIRGSSRSFWTDARRNARLSLRPHPGDLVFFDRTYDANRNRRVDDLLTHVAVVTRVDDDGTVVMVHRGSSGIRQLRMNLSYPSTHRRGDKVINDFLRARGYGGKRSPRLAGQLFRAVARPPGPKGVGRIN
ncbi:MAG: CHAP domain-containing protein [Myxococcota bacterium]